MRALIAVLVILPLAAQAAPVPHHRKLWETGNRAAMGPAERAAYDRSYAEGQRLANAQLAAAAAVLAAPVTLPAEEPSVQTWRVRGAYSTTRCGQAGRSRWITAGEGDSMRRWDEPSAGLWSSSGCAASKPRMVSREEFLRQQNELTRQLRTPLKFDELKAEMQALASRNQDATQP